KAMGASGQNRRSDELYPVHEGFGRTDALGRIGNTAFGDHLSASNYQIGDAPVSYPYVWNIWKFDWVQYNGSVSQPLARNVGEALGVGAVTPLLSAVRGPIPASERYRSSVDIPGLLRIEHTLQQLRPPQWPAEIFGAVDPVKVARGEALFKQRCEECHGPHVAEENRQLANAPLKPSHEMEWRMEVIPLDHIGTDPNAANGFMKRRYDLSLTGLTNAEMDAALRPLFTRQLLRDVRFRMREIVRLSTDNSGKAPALPKELAKLAELTTNYPDPEAAAIPVIPTELFASIDAAVVAPLPMPAKLPDADWRPADPLGCALECHVVNLLWDL
ncbi:MAG: di-heme-cytochrome C peroxidase, partial [Peristeroidobacter soli]